MNVTSLLITIDAEIARLQEARTAISALAGLPQQAPSRPSGISKKPAKKLASTRQPKTKVVAVAKKRQASKPGR